MILASSERGSVEGTKFSQMGDNVVATKEELSVPSNFDLTSFAYQNREAVSFENASINVDNSTDVIFGPVTHFNVNGNVTIVHNGNGEEVDNEDNEKKTSVSSYGAAGLKSRSRCQCCKPVLLILNLHWIVIRNTLIAGVFLFVVIVTVLLIVKTTDSKTNEITFEDPFYNGSLGNHSVIYRKQWGGVTPKSIPIRLKHPVDTLIVSCSLKDFCNTSDTCASAVRNLQKLHQSVRRFPDVGYNFMIGGDGGIYVGTGWDYINFHRKTSIGIDFLGNFVYDKLTEDMIDAFHQLVNQGLSFKKLTRDYKLVGENQTDPTVYLSPGPNVIKFMETWPHFYNKTWF